MIGFFCFRGIAPNQARKTLAVQEDCTAPTPRKGGQGLSRSFFAQTPKGFEDIQKGGMTYETQAPQMDQGPQSESPLRENLDQTKTALER